MIHSFSVRTEYAREFRCACEHCDGGRGNQTVCSSTRNTWPTRDRCESSTIVMLPLTRCIFMGIRVHTEQSVRRSIALAFLTSISYTRCCCLQFILLYFFRRVFFFFCSPSFNARRLLSLSSTVAAASSSCFSISCARARAFAQERYVCWINYCYYAKNV